MTLSIREFADGDAEALRACFIGLQDAERAFEPRLRPGASIVDEYRTRPARRAEGYARTQGASELRINALARNSPARELYRSCGFAPHLESLSKDL